MADAQVKNKMTYRELKTARQALGEERMAQPLDDVTAHQYVTACFFTINSTEN